ncbi:MAG: hypothetical protein KJ067_20625 [Vicinamibacteria bacterium]|nr:hypothetical protein [Vicinamibacteria bacterium]
MARGLQTTRVEVARMKPMAAAALVAAMVGHAGVGGEQLSSLLLAAGAAVALSLARRLPPEAGGRGGR